MSVRATARGPQYLLKHGTEHGAFQDKPARGDRLTFRPVPDRLDHIPEPASSGQTIGFRPEGVQPGGAVRGRRCSGLRARNGGGRSERRGGGHRPAEEFVTIEHEYPFREGGLPTAYVRRANRICRGFWRRAPSASLELSRSRVSGVFGTRVEGDRRVWRGLPQKGVLLLNGRVIRN